MYVFKNYWKVMNIMCMVYFDIWLWENIMLIYVKCESNVDFNFGVCNCFIILFYIYGVNLFECLIVFGFKMVGILIIFIWSLCY